MVGLLSTHHARLHTKFRIVSHAQRGVNAKTLRQPIDDAEARLERVTQQVAEVVSSWSMAPVVEAYQSMRGGAFLTAVTFVAEIGAAQELCFPTWTLLGCGSLINTCPGPDHNASPESGIRTATACIESC